MPKITLKNLSNIQETTQKSITYLRNNTKVQ